MISEEKSKNESSLVSLIKADINDLNPFLQQKISVYQQSNAILKVFLNPTIFSLKAKVDEFLHYFSNEL